MKVKVYVYRGGFGGGGGASGAEAPPLGRLQTCIKRTYKARLPLSTVESPHQRFKNIECTVLVVNIAFDLHNRSITIFVIVRNRSIGEDKPTHHTQVRIDREA